MPSPTRRNKKPNSLAYGGYVMNDPTRAMPAPTRMIKRTSLIVSSIEEKYSRD